MGELFNLTNANVKLYDGAPRNMDPTFGEAYFDKTRDTGYGGYHYDGRWEAVAAGIAKRYMTYWLIIAVVCSLGMGGGSYYYMDY